MAKQRRTSPPPPPPAPKSVTAERAGRLVRLLRLLQPGPQTRGVLMRRLGLDIRAFYRDLEMLRGVGVVLTLENQRYGLTEDVEAAITRLPFPDPHLTFGEVMRLAKGRTKVNEKLKAQLNALTGLS